MKDLGTCECGNPKAVNATLCPMCQQARDMLRAQVLGIDAVGYLLFGGTYADFAEDYLGCPANVHEAEREEEGKHYAR